MQIRSAHFNAPLPTIHYASVHYNAPRECIPLDLDAPDAYAFRIGLKEWGLI